MRTLRCIRAEKLRMVDAFAVFISEFRLHTVHSIGPNRNDFILNVVVLQILPHVIDHVLKKKETHFFCSFC